VKTILVVDDEPEYRELAERLLSQAGYAVLTASNGAEALRAFSEKSPDLLLLDVMLPDMLGFDLCRRIRRGKERADTPILFCSVRSAVTSLAEGLKSGSTDYVIKPFEPKDLLKRVRAALAGRS
jgi:DNA-binding response OmpR family regulator